MMTGDAGRSSGGRGVDARLASRRAGRVAGDGADGADGSWRRGEGQPAGGTGQQERERRGAAGPHQRSEASGSVGGDERTIERRRRRDVVGDRWC